MFLFFTPKMNLVVCVFIECLSIVNAAWHFPIETHVLQLSFIYEWACSPKIRVDQNLLEKPSKIHHAHPIPFRCILHFLLLSKLLI